MVWFSDETVKTQMMFHHYLCRLMQDIYDSIGTAPDEEEKKGGETEE
jgi:hypothetical protein